MGLCLFLILDLVILFNSVRIYDRSSNQKVYIRFAVAVALQQLFGVLTQLCEPAFGITNQAFTYFVYIFALTFMTCASFYCYRYMRVTVSDSSYRPRLKFFLQVLPVIVIFVTCALSPITHWIFYVDETGVYHRGVLFILQLLCPDVYLFLILGMGLYYKKSGSKHVKRMFRFFLVFMVPSLVGFAIQMFVVKGGYSAIGISFGLLLMYLEIFIEDVNENKRLKSIESLNAQLKHINEEQKNRLEEISQLNRDLEAARIAAESANAAKTVFLNNMSHDIRTPLNAILGFSNLMAKEKNNPDLVEGYLNKIKTSGEFLLSIINNVLDMARIESGKVIVENSFFDLKAGLDGLHSYIDMLARSSNHNFTMETSFEHRYVMLDTAKYQQILMNLISNAIKYTPANGSIHLQIDELPCNTHGFGTFRMRVADSGVGMTPEFLEHIFDSFSRERNTTESKIIGTGLGMSIVKRLTDLLDAKIEVVSEKNVGTVFTVTSDLEIIYNPDAYISISSNDDPAAVSLKGKRILLTEDNDMNAEIATEVLEDEGFIVERAENGLVCIDMITNAPSGYYDVILMDIQMPFLNGYDTSKRLREMGLTLPIVAMTANAFEEDRRNAYDAGMDAHLSKPIDVIKVMNTLSALLR